MATEAMVLELQVVLEGTNFPTGSTKTTGFSYIQGLWYSFYTKSTFYGSQVFATAEYSVQVTFST